MIQFIFSFTFLFGFWMILSGKTDLFHLALGFISVLIVCVWTAPLMFQGFHSPGRRIKEHFAFFPYALWLFYQIIIANFQVLKLALSSNLSEDIKPSVITFESGLKRDISKFVLANSITLTPGTVTIKEEDGKFWVHCLTPQAAKGIPGDMLKKVQKMFGESIS